MRKKINTKKLIQMNKEFGGALINKSNLDFAVDDANREKNIYRSNAKLLRGIVSGHPFLDGNKRTTIIAISKRFAAEDIKCNKKAMTKGIVNIAKKRITNLNKIEKRLRKWCMKK